MPVECDWNNANVSNLEGDALDHSAILMAFEIRWRMSLSGPELYLLSRKLKNWLRGTHHALVEHFNCECDKEERRTSLEQIKTILCAYLTRENRHLNVLIRHHLENAAQKGPNGYFTVAKKDSISCAVVLNLWKWALLLGETSTIWTLRCSWKKSCINCLHLWRRTGGHQN